VRALHIPDRARRRMQTAQAAAHGAPPSTLGVLRASVAGGGFRSLYVGITASLARQMSYSLVRLGAYERLKHALAADAGGKPSTGRLMLAAGVAGGLGGIAGNPAGASSALVGGVFHVDGRGRYIARAHDERRDEAAGAAV
jgi:dicarboxylate transporter 10